MDHKTRADILKHHISNIKQLPNVVGGGVGKRFKNGSLTNEDVVHIFVKKKIAERDLNHKEIIPKTLKSPKTLSHVATDVLVVGDIKPLDNRDVFRPILGGVSVANPLSGVLGTMSGIFRDTTDGKPVLLGNNHVLARQNHAAIGENIEQPAPSDNGGGGVVATLKRFITLNASPTINQVDAAIADLVPALENNYDIAVTHLGLARSLLPNPPINKIVQKSGRTSEQTLGTVISTNASVTVTYSFGDADFENQIITSNMLIAGDSGSLLYSLTGELIGLGYAGSDQIAVFVPIDLVFAQMNIESYNMLTIQEYKNQAYGGFFYKEASDDNKDPNYPFLIGTTFLLYPAALNSSVTAPLKRWKTLNFPAKYALSTSLPDERYIEDTTLGRIAISQQEDSLPLKEWIEIETNNRFYTTETDGGGIDTTRFIEQPNPVGYVATVSTNKFVL